MQDSKKETKQSISLRIARSDLSKVRSIATRLRTRESDVFRFAIKIALAKLSPLYDSQVKGVDLMPVFIECGSDLASHFNLDSEQLNKVINADLTDTASTVDLEDINLLAMSTMPDRYLQVKLRELTEESIERTGVSEALQKYLDKKYLETAPTTSLKGR